MDMEDESEGKSSAGATTVAEMDPMVMMERFSQMQNAVQQMQETMQHLQQEVTSFRQQNARLTSQLTTHRVSNKRARRFSPPAPNSDTQASQFLGPMVIKVEVDDNKRARSISLPAPNSDTQASQLLSPIVVKVEVDDNMRARSISPPTPNSDIQASQLPSPMVIKVEQDDWSDNTQEAANKTEPCADGEPYGTSAGHSDRCVSDQSVKQESNNIRYQGESEDRVRMTWENSEQGTTIIARQPSAQHTAHTAPDWLSPNDRAREIVEVTSQHKRNSDKRLLSAEKIGTLDGSNRSSALHHCDKCSTGRHAAKLCPSSSTSLSSSPLITSAKLCPSSSTSLSSSPLITSAKKRRVTKKTSSLKCADHWGEHAADFTAAIPGNGCCGKGGELLVVERGELEKEFSRMVRDLSEKQMMLLLKPQQEPSGETEQTPSPNDTESAPPGPKLANCRLTDRHFPAKIPLSATLAQPKKNCRVCYARMKMRGDSAKERKNRRRVTKFWCPSCAVPMCVDPCFQVFHTKRDYAEV